MSRPDLASDLVHFIRATSLAGAFNTLEAIRRTRMLIGSRRMVRGDHRVVCFSEAPLNVLGKAVGLAASGHGRYQPVGVMVSKRWLFERGGRPVIYQTDSEYAGLSEATQWRHVRFDLGATPPVDFTWEREWRVRVDELPFSPNDVRVVVPDQEVLAWLRERHDREQDDLTQSYGIIMGQELAEAYREGFPWDIVNLRLDQLLVSDAC